jgi:peptide/nickel transport system permease protein
VTDTLATPAPGGPDMAADDAAVLPARPHFLRRLLRRPSAVFALGWILTIYVCSIAAPWLAPHDPAATSFAESMAGPSLRHIFGADSLGRDTLSRLMYGGRAALMQTLLGLSVFLVVGLTLGLVAGFGKRVWDVIILRIVDLKYAIPGIIIMLVVLTVFPGNWNAAVIAFGILGAANLTRVVRSSTLAVREELYIAAARVAGLNALQIVWRHVLPRIATVIIIQASVFSGVLLVVIATLSFLGLDADPYAPSWGGMLNLAAQKIARSQWPLFPPGLVITLTVLSFGLLGDAIREVSAENWSRSMLAKRRHADSVALPAASPAEAAPPYDPAALLSVRGLSVAFGRDDALTEVVQDVSFDVYPGETIGLVGESGCGKSVTGLALLGLVPQQGRIVRGGFVFDGADITHADDKALKSIRGKRIAYVSQEPMVALDPTFTVGAQLGEAVRCHTALSGRAARQRVTELLAMVNLPNPKEVARRYPHQLSGGMAQRVAIALALSGSPQLLIADEPTTALDVTVQAEILDLLFGLQKSQGMAIILISHDWGVIADMCLRTVVMYAGQVVEYGPLDAIMRRPSHPYTSGLLAANPHAAIAGERLSTIPGTVPPPARWPRSCHFAARCSFASAACRADAIPMVEVGAERVSRCIHTDQVLAAGGSVH